MAQSSVYRRSASATDHRAEFLARSTSSPALTRPTLHCALRPHRLTPHSDDDSIASYSTLGSYTAYTGSVAGSYIAGSAATGTGSGHRPRTSSTARELADLELRSRLSPPPARSASPHTRHFPPRLDGSAILRSRSPGLGESALSPRLSPAISGLSSVSELPGKDQIPFPGLPEHHSSNFSLGSSSDSMRERATSTASALLDGKPLPDEHVNGTAIATEKEKKLEKRRLEDEKRRKRARNEEKWRKVRAREAAHDAPIRRWARFVQNRVGTKGAVLLALLGCWAVRILLAWASLCESQLTLSRYRLANISSIATTAIDTRPSGRQRQDGLHARLPVAAVGST